jgi:hypothetical protein
MFFINRVLDDLDPTKIQGILIIGRIVSFFMSVEDGKQFANRYSLKNTWIEGEGMYIDMLLPGPATPENVKEFFERFQEEDFSQELKGEFLYEYQVFTDSPSIDYLTHLIQDYIYFFNHEVMAEEKSLLEDKMPVYMDFITQVATIYGNWPSTITVDNTELDSNQVLKTMIAPAKHSRYILKPIKTTLLAYKYDLITKDELIIEMRNLLDIASETPFPDFGNLLPSLHQELADNISFLGENLNDLYSTIAKQLAIILKTQDLQFKTQTFPHPMPNQYLVINLEKKEFIDKTPVHKKVKSRINELKESENLMELLQFSPQKTDQTPLRSTLPRRSRMYNEVEAAENISIKEPMGFSPQKYASNRFSPQVYGKTKSRIEPKGSDVKKKLDFTPEKLIDVIHPTSELEPVDDYYKAINLLRNYEVGKSIIASMVRLKEGEQSWNPYWINSGLKLQGIIAAVLKLEKGEIDLVSLIQNEKSELNESLNMQRLLPITFLGRLGLNHAKSAMIVEDEVATWIKTNAK